MAQRIVKPKTQRGKRAVERKDPKIKENHKTCMLMKGGNTSQIVTNALKELHMLKKPHAVLFKKKNITRPFEDQSSLEFFSNKADAALFGFGSHSKKRPNNLIFGRLFDGHLLDMAEFGIEKFKSMMDIEGPKCAAGMKPALIFSGEAFDQDSDHKRIKNLFIDFFRGPVVDNVRLAGLEHVISLTAADGKIYLRNYKVQMKREAGSLGPPRVELENMGPSLDLVMRRTKLASDDLFKTSCKQPREAKIKMRKNISRDAFGTRLGRVHMTPQDLTKLPDRRMKRIKNITKDTEKDATEKDATTPAKKAKESVEED
ncbi:ribosome production factor 2 homolog [Littorina saxatilis]|uniref:Ribosome production factor 2 homolog n=1 Tax=Littorina saxatilis TaxID=31220 RepID=A0AAN9GI27_9CAEN